MAFPRFSVFSSSGKRWKPPGLGVVLHDADGLHFRGPVPGEPASVGAGVPEVRIPRTLLTSCILESRHPKFQGLHAWLIEEATKIEVSSTTSMFSALEAPR